MLEQPRHIPAAFCGVPTTYRWSSDVWHPIRSLETLSGGSHKAKEQKAHLQLGIPGALGFAAANAEWVVWRLRGVCDEPTWQDALQRVEATWAAATSLSSSSSAVALAEHSYPVGGRPDADAQGALSFVAMLTREAVERAQKNDPHAALSALSLSLLARHVATDAKLYDAWHKATFARIVAVHGRTAPPTPVTRGQFGNA